MLWDISAILVYTILIIGLTVQGYLPGGASAFFLFTFAAFKAVGRGLGGIGKIVYYLFIFFFYISIIFFVILKAGWQGLPKTIPILLGALGGGFEQVIAQILKMSMEGNVGFILAGMVIISLVFLRWIGGSSLFLYHSIFGFAPLFVLLIFLTTCGANWKIIVIQGGSLIVMLGGIYIMFYGFASSLRKK